jgi:tRNA(Ile)-lysidine synthase
VQIDIPCNGLDRFRQALTHLGISGPDRILLAISGGPDSLALLLLAHQACPGQLVAATVDHKLRPESAKEAEFVGDLCRDIDVPHMILQPAQPISGNIQSSARATRYALLEQAAHDHMCAYIATAHHGDDQLETMLMRLARGSGVDGMAAIRAKNGRIVRPMLGFSKAELEQICTAAGVEPVRDPSNENADFDRVAMRQWIAQASHPFQIERTNRTASALADAADALSWMTAVLAAERTTQVDSAITCDVNALPRELQRRLLLHCIAQLEPALHPKGEAVDRLLIELEAGKTAMIGNILCRGGTRWTLTPAPPRRDVG